MSTAPQGKAEGPGKEQLLTALFLGGLYPVLSRLVDSSLVALVCSVALGFVVSGLLRQRAQVRGARKSPSASESTAAFPDKDREEGP